MNLNGIRRVGHRQGLSQRRSVIQRVKSYQVRSYIPEKKQRGATPLGGQGGGTTGGLSEPAAGAGKLLRQEPAPAARRVGGTQLRVHWAMKRAACGAATCGDVGRTF